MGKRLLLVDDDPRILSLLSAPLEVAGLEVARASNLAEALEALDRREPDIVVSDIRLPDGTGIDLIAEGRQRCPDVPFVLMTAFATVDTAVDAVNLGAYHFLIKPFPVAQLQAIVDRALESKRLRFENAELRLRAGVGSVELVGSSPAMHAVRQQIARVAVTPSTVLLSGESGTGKEIAAQLVHDLSPRKDKPFVRINCSAIPSELLEGELFGHRRGAFSGAETDRQGKLLAADGGTVFLDEIATMDLELQSKLLRTLEEGEIQPLGADRPRHVDLRIVAASNQSLTALADEGRFRRDLYFRLNVFPVHMPPLRERLDDLPELVDHLLPRICRRVGRPHASIAPGSIELLASHDWPGNVRELENVIERSAILSLDDVLVFEELIPLRPQHRPATHVPDDLDLGRALDRVEKSVVTDALGRAQGIKKDAAKLLGISPRPTGRTCPWPGRPRSRRCRR